VALAVKDSLALQIREGPQGFGVILLGLLVHHLLDHGESRIHLLAVDPQHLSGLAPIDRIEHPVDCVQV
jgi:hypothetical protein